SGGRPETRWHRSRKPGGRARSRGCRRPSSPYLPRGLARRPQVVQQLHLTRCVHGLPEAIVRISHELAVSGQPGERLALQHDIVVDGDVALEYLPLEHHEAAVDGAAARLGFLFEGLDDPAVANAQLTEPARWMHGRPRC